MRNERIGMVGLLGMLAWMGSAGALPEEKDFLSEARQAVPRDAFPVLNEPHLIPADQAKSSGIRDEEAVLGIAVGEEAQAYPVALMGAHELGNVVIGGVPVAFSW